MKVSKEISNYVFLNGLKKENKESKSNIYLTFKFIKNREKLREFLKETKGD